MCLSERVASPRTPSPCVSNRERAVWQKCMLPSRHAVCFRYVRLSEGISCSEAVFGHADEQNRPRRYALRLHSEKQKNRRNECSYRFQFSQVPNLGLSPCVGDVRSCVLRLILRELQSWSCQ